MKTLTLALSSALLFAFLAAVLLKPKLSAGAAPAISTELISQVAIDHPSRKSVETLDSRDTRVRLAPGEVTAIRLNFAPGVGPVRAHAPNGGSINNRGAEAEINAAGGGPVTFNFKAGTAPGRYTIELSDGQTTNTLDFWVGPEPPQGKPGPKLTFTGSR